MSFFVWCEQAVGSYRIGSPHRRRGGVRHQSVSRRASQSRRSARRRDARRRRRRRRLHAAGRSTSGRYRLGDRQSAFSIARRTKSCPPNNSDPPPPVRHPQTEKSKRKIHESVRHRLSLSSMSSIHTHAPPALIIGSSPGLKAPPNSSLLSRLSRHRPYHRVVLHSFASSLCLPLRLFFLILFFIFF